MSDGNLSYFNALVTLKIANGYAGSYGNQQFLPESVQLRAFVEPANELIRSPVGEEQIAESVALIHSPDRPINTLDEITLPDGSTPRILRIQPQRNSRGQTPVYKVSLGNSRRTG